MLKKLASENDDPAQKHMKKDVFNPEQLKFWEKVWLSTNTMHENK